MVLLLAGRRLPKLSDSIRDWARSTMKALEHADSKQIDGYGELPAVRLSLDDIPLQ